MHVIPSIFKLPIKLTNARKLINFGKYFLIALMFLLGLHLVAYANPPEVIVQPEWTANLNSTTKLLATDKQLFVVSQIYGADNPPELFALDISSGKVLWQQKILPSVDFPRRKLILDNGTIYVSYGDGVMGFEPETGSPKASINYVENPRGSFQDLTMGIHKGIAVYGESIPIDESFSSGMGYRTKVFGITKDKMLWSYQLPKTNGLIGISAINPLVQSSILLLPSFHDTSAGRIEQFTAIDVTSGKVLWTWEAPQKPNGLWSANVFGDTIYTSVLGSTKTQPSGRLRAIDLKTGKEKWSYVITGKAKAVSDREVLIWQPKRNSRGDFVVLDKESGRFLRRFTVTRFYDNEPQHLTWENGRVYMDDMEIKNVTLGFYGSADNNSWISAFDDKTGKLVWRTPTLLNSHIYHPPVVTKTSENNSEKKRLIFASHFLRKEGSSKVQAFSIP